MNSNDYLSLYSTCVLTVVPAKVRQLDYICRVALANQTLYELASHETGIPWPIIAAIHFRESNQSFKCHLHNGDPLTAKTVHVPVGRPVLGQPPFTWVASAIDALTGIWKPTAWSIAGCLEFLERYNGIGYQKHGVNTPYVWDYTDKYVTGLYISDGSFDPLAMESRPGAVSILKSLALKGVTLDFTILDSSGSLLH